MLRKTLSAAAATLLIPVLSLHAQEPRNDWEGRTLREIRAVGFDRQPWLQYKYRLRLREGESITAEKVSADIRELWQSGFFEWVDVVPKADPATPDSASVTISVREYVMVEAVEIEGAASLSVEKLKKPLRITAGHPLNPALLRQDQEEMRNRYVQEGYHFSTVEAVQKPTPGGVVLRWKISEGPRVTVHSIRFTGNEGIEDSDLLDVMVGTEENSWLFGVVPTEKKPFVLANLQQDLARIQEKYYVQGWLDVVKGDRVILEKLEFNRDKTLAFVTIHITEGPRYQIRSVSVRGNQVIPTEELTGKIRMKTGDWYDEERIWKDVQEISTEYGRRAYIMAKVDFQPLYSEKGAEVDLVYQIEENEKVYVGTLSFTGNFKTRDDVLRREFTRRGFVPGEEYNLESYRRAILTLQDRGFIDRAAPSRGIRTRHDPGSVPGTRDVTMDITEGQTGNVRFGAGYSSAFGVIGMIEYTQRNFDLEDLPEDLGEIFTGDAFSGGGQVLKLRAAPSAKSSFYALEFIEPYLFGHELEALFRVRRQTLVKASWEEQVSPGIGIGLEKRFDPFSVGFLYEFQDQHVGDVEPDAPAIVFVTEGENEIHTLTPRIVYNTVDSLIIPTEGSRLTLSYEYAGQILPGDFDYNRLLLDTDFFFPVFETEEKHRHVLSAEFRFGWVEPQRDWDEVPISERFFLGGRGTMRGFDYLGIGPRENGDPVGGEALVFASLEYLIPILTETLRGALFIDVGTLEPELNDLHDSHFRSSYGFGLRFLFPLGQVPVSLDFAWPIWKDDEDDRQTITFDLGDLFWR